LATFEVIKDVDAGGAGVHDRNTALAATKRADQEE
jgi:hypothetical protein